MEKSNVPGKINFQDLDDIIEDLFGWTHDRYMNFVTGKVGVVFNRQMMSISGIQKVWKI